MRGYLTWQRGGNMAGGHWRVIWPFPGDHSSAAKVLMEAGAQLDAQNHFGATPLDVAASPPLRAAMQQHRMQTGAVPQSGRALECAKEALPAGRCKVANEHGQVEQQNGMPRGSPSEVASKPGPLGLQGEPKHGLPKQRRVALVIGNDCYGQGLAALPNCVQDAKVDPAPLAPWHCTLPCTLGLHCTALWQDVAEILQAGCEFRVMLREHPSKPTLALAPAHAALQPQVMLLCNQSRPQMLATIRAFRQAHHVCMHDGRVFHRYSAELEPGPRAALGWFCA